ncbi:ATP-binding protein [Micromonospora sp. NBC_01740]|uniref:ATP-binding protein n=1 Tax=Micromonospora sp. NBC_01740 TaxID=2975986 RepID=UPI002E120FFA|nr:ATP-binding protein [Micromonospora sp. NBC_01740]
MNRSSTPGSPAGRPAVPHGNRARSFDYPDDPETDEVSLDPALVTTPGHGGVGVFQAPRPAPRRTPPPAEPQPADSADIDSPFLDLFGGTHPGATRPTAPPQRAGGREQPAIGQQPPAATPAPAALPPAPAPLPPPPRAGHGADAHRTGHPADAAPRTGQPAHRTAPGVTAADQPPADAYEPPARAARSRVPHQSGDRLPTLRPLAEAEDVPPVAAAPPTSHPAPRQHAAPLDPPAPDPASEPTSRRTGERPPERAGREVAPPRQRSAGRRDQPVKPTKPTRVKPPKIKFGDRDPAVELAITEIAGHLTFTPNTVTAWYWLPEVRWAFRPDAEREALLSAISEQYAGLAGFRLHLRRTTRPFPADEWARTIDAHTAAPLPDVPGTAGWGDHLVAAQRHLLSVNHAEGQTYLGVTFARRALGDSLTERLLRTFGRGVAEGERRKLGRTVEQFDEVLGAFGMRGRRVTAQELEWLLYRSVALCMAPPGQLSPLTDGQWERGDLLALTEQVERYRTPYGSTVKLVNRMTGEERHVAVLAVGRMEPLEIPERHEPWLHFHERLPWPMELSTRVDILGSGDSFRNLEHRLRMIRSQQLDYAEHGIDAPPELERLAKRALVIGDEMTTGLPVDSARAHGWHRIAVGGRNREECLERARRLIQLYSRELRISLQHPKNQDWLAREFIPGEPIANTGYVRRMPVNLLAAALPQAASTVGDRRGDLIGRTAGTCRRPVFLDLHFPMEVRERSGLAVFVAEPGGGKSTLLGALGYLAARRGVQVTLLDPSGPLARLCAMPELRPYARVLNLTGSEHGTLAPYSLIPTPLRSEFGTGASGDREFEIAVSNARAERRMLVQDICMMLVPPQVAREASTATLFRHAVRQVPAEETSTLDDVVACLSQLDDDAGKELANLLLDTAEMPLAMLFFGRPPEGLLGADAALTVITMAGLRLPDLKIEREYWSAEEALALPMLHTAHRLAVRRCYGGSMSSRKLVGLDEAHFMEGWRSGRSFLVRLARDSRKWNLAALVASQNPRDILGLDVQNLVSTVFVGRIAEDAEIASEALRLLRVPVNDGYEATLASLSTADATSSSRLGFREFVMRDVDGRVQKVRVDVSYVDGLLDHLDTTPAAIATAAGVLPAILPNMEA